MKWTLLDRGFLPTPDPIARIADGPYAHVEQLGHELPDLVRRRAIRDVAPATLRSHLDFHSPGAEGNDLLAERLFLLFSYIASAYVHAPGLPAISKLPREIAGPLVQLSRICERPPILSYASYCLHNWRRIDPAGPIALGNIELTQNFSTAGDGKSDEDWFILVHVDIEARAGVILSAFQTLPAAIREDSSALARSLEQIHGGLKAMNRTMARMPEGCSSEVYFRKVRPYIFGFDNIIYEGCFGDVPQSFRGETGAQSSIIPAVNAALGIRHKDSLLTRHLDDMRNYMPAEHRRFIESQVSVRARVKEVVGHNESDAALVKDLYNACVAEVIAFRSRHFEYAVNYIQKKVDNPLATGGTPYITWLKQLIAETETHYL
jgi:indoleamine 2,3-dioxygenase